MILSAALVHEQTAGCFREEWQLAGGTCALGVGRTVTLVKALAVLDFEPASVDIPTDTATRWGLIHEGAFFKERRNE